MQRLFLIVVTSALSMTAIYPKKRTKNFGSSSLTLTTTILGALHKR